MSSGTTGDRRWARLLLIHSSERLFTAPARGRARPGRSHHRCCRPAAGLCGCSLERAAFTDLPDRVGKPGWEERKLLQLSNGVDSATLITRIVRVSSAVRAWRQPSTLPGSESPSRRTEPCGETRRPILCLPGPGPESKDTCRVSVRFCLRCLGLRHNLYVNFRYFAHLSCIPLYFHNMPFP